MNVFIVFARHEPKSFNAALLARSVAQLTALGHTVQVSDLYAMHFNPLAGAQDFTARRFPEQLQYDREQKYAQEHQAFAPDIQAGIDKLLWCDLLILQFPLWWFSVPAILKGWIDRTFVNGVAYGKGRRMDTGGLKGRRAMLTVSTGCYEKMVAPDGLLGDLNANLWHLHAPPFMSWSIHYTDGARRSSCLDAYAERMRELETMAPMFFHPTRDFGPDWRLKPGVAPATVAHRRELTASPLAPAALDAREKSP